MLDRPLSPPSGSEQTPDAPDDNRINVYARLRPTFPRDREEPGFEEIVKLQHDGKSLRLVGGKMYQFDGTFGPKAGQEQVWFAAAKPVVENVFKGYCGTCLCYGQTGTGKSYTMSNMNLGEEGVIMQSMMHIFQRRQEDPDREYDLKFSYLQIYRDRVGDLMKPEVDNLDIVKSDSGEVSIPGLSEYECNSRERFIELYDDGDSHRVVAATKSNPVSSRGHACVMIGIRSRPKGDDGTGEYRSAKMWMIDLAGYERFSKTGVLCGIRKEEARCINASLLSLGNVISALSDKSPHIPWRNSKLTRLLQDAIGGRSKCTVMLTLGPSGTCFHETVGTLYFGSRAMAVKTEAKLTLNTDYVALCKKLEAMLTEERQKYTDMEVQFTKRQIEAQQREERMKREMAKIKARHEQEYARLISSGADSRAIEALIKENEAEIELVQEQQQEEILIAEERHDEEVKQIVQHTMEQQVGVTSQELDQIRREHLSEVSELRGKLRDAQLEVGRLGQRELECLRLHEYISRLKEDHAAELLREREQAALSAGVSPEGVDQLKKQYDRQVQSIRSLLDATHEARIAELQEAQEAELRRLRKLHEDSLVQSAREYERLRDCMARKHEQELARCREKSREVQEKLKRNHFIIKNSYQEQKVKLQEELAELRQGQLARIDGEHVRLTAEYREMQQQYQQQFDRLKRKVASLEHQLQRPRPHPPTPYGCGAVDVPPRAVLQRLREGRLGRIAYALGMTEEEDAGMRSAADYVAWIDARRPLQEPPPRPAPTSPSVDRRANGAHATPPPPPPLLRQQHAVPPPGQPEAAESPRAEARLRRGSALESTPQAVPLRPLAG